MVVGSTPELGPSRACPGTGRFDPERSVAGRRPCEFVDPERGRNTREAQPLRSLRFKKSLMSGNTSLALSSRTKWPVSSK